MKSGLAGAEKKHFFFKSIQEGQEGTRFLKIEFSIITVNSPKWFLQKNKSTIILTAETVNYGSPETFISNKLDSRNKNKSKLLTLFSIILLLQVLCFTSVLHLLLCF